MLIIADSSITLKGGGGGGVHSILRLHLSEESGITQQFYIRGGQKYTFSERSLTKMLISSQ